MQLDYPYALAFSHDGKYLVTAGKVIRKFEAAFRSSSKAPCGERVIITQRYDGFEATVETEPRLLTASECKSAICEDAGAVRGSQTPGRAASFMSAVKASTIDLKGRPQR